MIFVIFLVVGFICAVIGVNMARERNRDPAIWGLICLLFGIFGIIFLAISGEAPKQKSNNAVATAHSDKLKRWETLIEVDPEIAAAADQARAVSPRAERALSEKYLTLNDKAYLPAILKNILENSEEYRGAAVVSRPLRTGEVRGYPYRERPDQTFIITKGKFVGKVFPSYEDLESFVISI